jgi:hypothetical protein
VCSSCYDLCHVTDRQNFVSSRFKRALPSTDSRE